MQANEQFLKRVFLKYLPFTVFSVLGGTVNIMIDSLIVGNVMGPQGLVAINLCTPVQLFMCTFGSLVGSGAATLSSIEIGKNEQQRGQGFYTQAIFMCALLSVLLMALGLIFLKPLVLLLGANSEIYSSVYQYTFFTVLGAAPKLLLYIPFNYLRLDGKPRLVTVTMITMMSVNAVLDVLFMAVLGWGMGGASLASVISELTACLLGFYFLSRPSSGFHLCRVRLNNIAGIIKTGSPVAINNLLSAVRLIFLNGILLSAVGNTAVAFFAVANSMSEFSLCLINGVPQTAAPMVGVCYGERDNRSIRFLLKRQLVTGIFLAAIYALLLAVFNSEICMLFGAGPEGGKALLYLAFSIPFAMFNSCAVYFFNATSRIMLADIITAARIFIFAVIPAAILSATGLSGSIWLFFPLSEVLTMAATFAAVLCMSYKKPKLSRFLLMDESLEREGRTINFSVENSVEAVCEASEKISCFCEQNSFSSKQTYVISLAIEEMLTVIQKNCFKQDIQRTVDVRVFTVQDVIGIRLRSDGQEFNPLTYYEANRENDVGGETLGIQMIVKMATEVIYQRTFGVNCLIILL